MRGKFRRASGVTAVAKSLAFFRASCAAWRAGFGLIFQRAFKFGSKFGTKFVRPHHWIRAHGRGISDSGSYGSACEYGNK